jgi:hypothetical protein
MPAKMLPHSKFVCTVFPGGMQGTPCAVCVVTLIYTNSRATTRRIGYFTNQENYETKKI